ncbi:hypothetical protein BGZ51_007753 [Haplosporangium sp. Z 767]|nr:hypothetical protein BGZ51_007753 [Haplosporangium sp. Z 767]
MTLPNMENKVRHSDRIRAIKTRKAVPATEAIPTDLAIPTAKGISLTNDISLPKVISPPMIISLDNDKGRQIRSKLLTPSRSQSPESKEEEHIKEESKEQECTPELRPIKTEQQEVILSNDRESEALTGIDGDVRAFSAKASASKAPLLTPSPTPSRSSSPVPENNSESESHAKKGKDMGSNAEETTKELAKDERASKTSGKAKVQDENDEKVKALTEAQSLDAPTKQVKQLKQVNQTKLIDDVDNEAIAKLRAEREAMEPRLVHPGDAGADRGMYPRFRCTSRTKSGERCIVSQYEVICHAQDAADFRCSSHDNIGGVIYSSEYPHIRKEYRHMKPYRAPVIQAESTDLTFELKGKSTVVFSGTRFDELTKDIEDANCKIHLRRIIVEYFTNLARMPPVTRNSNFDKQVKLDLSEGMVYYLLVKPLTNGLFTHPKKADVLNAGVVIKCGFTTRGEARIDEHERSCGIKRDPCMKFPRAGQSIFPHLLEQILQALWYDKQVDMQCENVSRCKTKHIERHLDAFRPVATEWMNAVKELRQLRRSLIDEHKSRGLTLSDIPY